MVKNLYRKFKLIFRKPKVGEFWSIDRAGKTETFVVTKKVDKSHNMLRTDYHYTFKFYDSWTWDGPISQAGPIYLARNNSLEFGLSMITHPKPDPGTIPTPPTRRY